jgi:tetratricopeptide (TPR) repeat protein
LILITRDGKVKLLDFGIAKLLKSDAENQTATKNFVFTPEYASPEQVRGEKLTTATDIYSLGVILYELLTGNRPYKTDSKNISEIIHAVCETEPLRPSSMVSFKFQVSSSGSENEISQNNEQRPTRKDRQKSRQPAIGNPKSLKGDLDNIILKSLRKEPVRRYSSVEQFSEDIRRHQTGLPVSASKDTWSYRTSKFMRRNRLGVVAAGLILITLLGGLATTLYQANKAQHRFDDVRQLANSFLFEFHDAIENLPGSTPARELVVKRAVEYLDKLAAESGNDASLQRELAAAYAKIGKIQGNSYYSNLGDTEGAMKSYRRSLEICQPLADADPNDREWQNELAAGHEGVGDMLYTINDLNESLQSYETAVALREPIVAAEPDNLKYRSALAETLFKRGDVKGMEGFPNLGDTPGALESYRRAIALSEEIIKAEPDNQHYKGEYAMRLTYLGMLQVTTGDAKNAIITGEKSIAILKQAIAAEPNNASYQSGLLSALIFQRFPLLEEGRTAEAIENARRVIQAMGKMTADDPQKFAEPPQFKCQL